MNEDNFWAGENAYISLYDDFSGNLKTNDEIRFYSSLFADNQKLVEFGCGTGRILIPLLRAGFRIDGLDISAGMIRILKKKLKKQELGAVVYRGDLCKFRLRVRDKYGGAILSQRTLNFITDADGQLLALSNIGSVLKKGAKLVINLMPSRPDRLALVQKKLVRTGKFMNGRTGKTVEFWENWIPDPVKQLWTMDQEFREGDKKKRCKVKMKMKVIFLPELKFMLRLSGFRLNGVYGNWRGKPFGMDSKDLIVVAEKVG